MKHSALERRRRVHVILARTAAGRAELDAHARGADMRALDKLPISEPSGRRRERVKIGTNRFAQKLAKVIPIIQLDNRPAIAPPVLLEVRELDDLKRRGRKPRRVAQESSAYS